LGDVDKGEAIDLLANYGTTRTRAESIARNWDCEKSSRGRAVAASKLCDWLARGAIDAADFRRRLVNLGYTEADAAIMVEDCLIAISTKRLKQAEKEAKEDAALRQRQLKAMQQAQRSIVQEENRYLRMREAAKKVRLNREKQFLTAVDKLTDKLDVGTFAATKFLGETKRNLQDQLAATVDESLMYLLKGVEEWDGSTLENLAAIIVGMAVAARSESVDDESANGQQSDNTNGSTQPSA
jgi:hypothetical protein